MKDMTANQEMCQTGELTMTVVIFSFGASISPTKSFHIKKPNAPK